MGGHILLKRILCFLALLKIEANTHVFFFLSFCKDHYLFERVFSVVRKLIMHSTVAWVIHPCVSRPDHPLL